MGLIKPNYFPIYLMFLILSLSLLLLHLEGSGSAEAIPDPELAQCQHQCRHLREVGDEAKVKCMTRCEEYYRQKRKIQRKLQKDCREVLGDQDYCSVCLRRCPVTVELQGAKEGPEYEMMGL